MVFFRRINIAIGLLITNFSSFICYGSDYSFCCNTLNLQQENTINEGLDQTKFSQKSNFLEKNKKLFEKFKDIFIGLPNPLYGNLCYINSVLQVLMNIKPLIYAVLKKNFTPNENQSDYEGFIIECFLRFLSKAREISDGNNKNSTKKIHSDHKKLIEYIKKFNPIFNDSNPDDAMAFCLFFLNALHEDTNLYIRIWGDQNEPENPNIKAVDSEDAFDKWEKYINYHNKSLIFDLFFGTIKYTYTCSVCKNKTCNFEVYSGLSLPLSDSIKDYDKKIEGKIDIEQCFNYYFNNIGKNTNSFYCEKCKKDVKRAAKVSIVTSPPYLIIHLARTHNRTKNFNFIDYPIYNFDVSKYVENSKGKYDLIGIVNHYGSGGTFGHFTAYCKKNEKWYEFNDAFVRAIDEKNIKSNNTYMLFYKRQNVMEEIDFEKLYEKYKNNIQ